MIFVAFIVCYLPIAIWAMIDTSHGAGWLIYEDISTYMLNLSPAISIAIYGGTHRKFKKSFRELLRINQVNPIGSGENSHGSNKTSIRKISPGMFTVASLNAQVSCVGVQMFIIDFLQLPMHKAFRTCYNPVQYTLSYNLQLFLPLDILPYFIQLFEPQQIIM